MHNYISALENFVVCSLVRSFVCSPLPLANKIGHGVHYYYNCDCDYDFARS